MRELFLEYAQSLAISLESQGFACELAALPGAYAPPSGRLLLALEHNKAIGCVGLRRLDDACCEMKRLYVRPPHRNQNLGHLLAQRVVAEARSVGYHTMYLDTLPTMTAAQQLYVALGFTACKPYYDNSAIGSHCMMLTL